MEDDTKTSKRIIVRSPNTRIGYLSERMKDAQLRRLKSKVNKSARKDKKKRTN